VPVITCDGTGVVSHAGTVLLAELADRIGLTATLSEATDSLRERRAGHDPGRVLVDVAVAIADDAVSISDVQALADQQGLHGPAGSVASTPTIWRVLADIAERIAIRDRDPPDALAEPPLAVTSTCRGLSEPTQPERVSQIDGELSKGLGDDLEAVLNAQAVAHGAKCPIICHTDVAFGEQMGFDIPAILGAGTLALVCSPVGGDGAPRFIEARQEMAGDQILGWKRYLVLPAAPGCR